MPEAFAVLAVVVVTVAAWVGAWMHTRNPSNHDARAELARLRFQAAWLVERLEVARRENWGGEMIGHLSNELGATSRQLASVSAQWMQRRTEAVGG